MLPRAQQWPINDNRQLLSFLATQQKAGCWIEHKVKSCVFPSKCPVGKTSISPALQDFVLQFSHCPSAPLCHHCVPLFIYILCLLPTSRRPMVVYPKCFLSSSLFVCFLLFLPAVHAHAICVSLFLSFCIFLCCWPCCRPELFDFATPFSHPVVHMKGVAINQRGNVMT